MDTHKPHKISWLSKAFVTIGLGAIGSLLATMIWESSLCATWRKDNPIDTLLGTLGPQMQKYGIGFVGFVIGSLVSLVYYLLNRRGAAVIHTQDIYNKLTAETIKPTSQQIPQRKINNQVEIAAQFQKPRDIALEALKTVAQFQKPRDIAFEALKTVAQFQKPRDIAFETLKFLAYNPREASLDVQGIASLYYNNDLDKAKSCIRELKGMGYVKGIGPPWIDEYFRHYQITEKGIACVKTYDT